MQKGNNCNALQTAEKTLTADGECRTGKDYSDNLRLLEIARRGDEDSERATAELVLLNTGLVRSIALRFRE